MLHKMLFDTELGGWLLTQLEQRAGLAVVRAAWLADQEISPAAAVESDAGPVDTGTEPNVQGDFSTAQATTQGRAS
jgi:hypothetical protein